MADEKHFDQYAISFEDFHINVTEFLKKPTGKLADGYEKEFNDLKEFEPIERQSLFTDGKSIKKNRYANILPGKEKRVVLEVHDGDPSSDYINANIHESSLSGSMYKYISTQAPIGSTFGDFWRMAYEKNSTIILMLTKFQEADRIKADRYWSDTIGESKVYGLMTVTLIDIETFHDTITTRKFSVSKRGFDQVKQVAHLQYTGWPDFGIPKEMEDFASFFSKYRSFRCGDVGPIVAHCSAGVGRSGTFIAMDIMLDHIEYELVQEKNDTFLLNIPKLVHELRKERPGMIQKKDQYAFVYEFIDYCIENKLYGIVKPE